MLFNSYTFIFLFLPVAIIGFCESYRIGGQRAAAAWILGASLFFYGWWNPVYLALLVGSITFNYFMGQLIREARLRSPGKVKAGLLVGVAGNLALLGYFKYANFFADNINSLIGTDIVVGKVVLPLAISFFTFQQITYLVDSRRGEVEETGFINYFIFVSFFPQLIAGPIVHHKEMMPQFKRIFESGAEGPIKSDNLAIGLTLFSIGLMKKVVFADGVGYYADWLFKAAGSGAEIGFFDSWMGTLAFGLQIYFDFSGYTDMAIGIAYIFGIRLPLNFNSPYKATSVRDFWRRWHITLTRFLRDYVYIPLGGNRKGIAKTLANVLITMFLCGLWHGANWTFVIWGVIQGFYIACNQIWDRFKSMMGFSPINKWWSRGMARAVTFIAITFAWAFFRAENLDQALNIVKALTGQNGFFLPFKWFDKIGPLGPMLEGMGVEFIYSGLALHRNAIIGCFSLLLVVLFMPNSQQFMADYRLALDFHPDGEAKSRKSILAWRPTTGWAYGIALMDIYIILSMSAVSEFLYWKF